MALTLHRVRARSLGVAAVLAAAGTAAGQETAQLIVQVSQATLAPGGSANVSVWVSYSPAVGGSALWSNCLNGCFVGTVVGFSLAVFNISASPAAGVAGSWSNLAYGSWASVFSSAGTINGNAVLGANIGTGFGPPLTHAVTENPLLLWTATWTASSTSGFGPVTLKSDVLQGIPQFPNTVHVWIQGPASPGGFAVEDPWNCTDGQGVITVIPAPGAAMGAIAGVWSLGRRRRARN